MQAFLRLLEAEGYMATIPNRGDEDAGAVLIKVNRFSAGCLVYSQVRDDKGLLVWLCGTGETAVPEASAEAYIARQRKYDADIWVVEVDDPKASYGLDGKVFDVRAFGSGRVTANP